MFWFWKNVICHYHENQTPNHMERGTTWFSCFPLNQLRIPPHWQRAPFSWLSSFPFHLLASSGAFLLRLFVFLSPPRGLFCSSQLSVRVLFSSSLLRCAEPWMQWRRERRCGGGFLHVCCPAEPLSPGISMTGSQPDGTEQVCSRWPSSLEGQDAQRSARRWRGGESGAQHDKKKETMKELRNYILILDDLFFE